MLGVAGAVGDPVGRATECLGAVRVADAGSKDDGADKSEEDAKDVEDQEDDGHGKAGDDAGDDAVETNDPGEGRDEHGEVYGGAGRRRGVVILGNDIANETSNDDCEDEGDAAQNEVEEA